MLPENSPKRLEHPFLAEYGARNRTPTPPLFAA